MNDRLAPADKCALIRVVASTPEILAPLESAARQRGARGVDRTLRALEATFDRPLAALRYGVYARGTDSPLQIGLHVGRPLASDHSNVARGPAARIVRRLADLAEPGQLLMTDAFFSQLASAGQTAFDARCHELGEYRLRPGGRPYRLHILAPEGASAAPRPRLGETNIDGQSSAFYGRESVLEQLSRALERHRIVTLTGPAGIGKSRTAREFLRRHRTADPSTDTWIVDLAHAESLQDVIDTIASTIGVSLVDDDDPLVTLGHAIAARTDCVLVLDGADAVAPAVAVCMQTLLPMAPSARWIVTARRALNLVPELEIELDGLSPDDAALLFQDRLDRTGRPFELDEQNLETVLDLVEAVGGSPLAVELAAHRSRTTHPATIADPFDATGDDRDALPADQAVATLLDPLIDELDAGGQTLLATCTIAPSPFPITIARAAAEADDGDPDARLSSLRSRGLLRILPGPGSEEILTVEVPPSVAEAVERRSLVDDRLVDRWISRFIEWLIGEMGEPPWIRTPPLLNRLARQRDNLAFAAKRGLDDGLDHLAIPLLALYTLVERRGANVTAARLLERAVDERADLFEEHELAALQTVRSHLHTLAGHRDRAAESADDALGHLDAEGSPDLATLARLARAHPRRSRVGDDEDPYARADAAAEDASRHAKSYVRMYQARHRLDRDDLPAAESHLREGFDFLTDEESQLAGHLERLAGEHAAASFRFREATDHLRRARAIFRRLGYDREVGKTLRLLGRVAHDDCNDEATASVLREALSLARQIGYAHDAAHRLGELGGLAFKRRDFGRARERLIEGLEIADSHEWPHLEGYIRAMLAATRAALGRVEAGDRQLAEVRRRLEPLPDSQWRPTFELVARIPDIARIEHGMAPPGQLESEQRAFLTSVSESGDFPALAQRDALRCLDSYLTFVEHGGRRRSGRVDRPRRPTLLIGPNGNWCRLDGGEPVDLSRQSAPRLIFARLVRHRLAFPGRPLTSDVLAGVGWPGAVLDDQESDARVGEVIGNLRALGLERPLIAREDGYLVSPEFAIRYARK